MRAVTASIILLVPLLATPVLAQQQHPPVAPAKPAVIPSGPEELAKSEDWIAAKHQEFGQTVCYAFTRAKNSTPAVANRTEVVLTVTQRPTGRDAVAISAGFTFPANAAVTVQVDQAGFDFYTAQKNAFARDGKVVVAAFQKAGQAMARSPGPREGLVVVDTFSLKGFSAAYAAINKACPAGR
jgi:hypothetical protein